MAMPLPLGRDSVSWRIVTEPTVIVATGGAALLLQVAHPLVAAGVEQHSDYQSKPWERLFRTLDTMFTITFGSPEASSAASRRLRGRHAGIRGDADDGRAYRALDPHLLLWVWATLVDTPLRAHDRFVGSLTADERRRFYAEQVEVALACGVPQGLCPPTLEAFAAYMDEARSQLRITPTARAVAASIAGPPLPWPVSPVAGAVIGALTAGALPPDVRRQYGLPWSPLHRQVMRAGALVARTGARLVPGAVRRFPAGVVAAA
jgi:uncharacterized protein (DUF2236 family)